MRAILFDLDGTLADTSGDLLAAGNAALNHLNIPARLERGRDDAVSLQGGKAMLRTGLARAGMQENDVDMQAGYQKLLQHYAQHIDEDSYLYPGAISCLEKLKKQGFALGVCTNKPEKLADLLLQKLGLRAYFNALIGADTLPTRKPDPAPVLECCRLLESRAQKALLVGDTQTDFDAARNAGLGSVLVRFRDDLSAVAGLTPEAWIDHFDELPLLAEKLLVNG